MTSTRKDVAKMAGVSVATVSNVINKTKQVTPKVKEKVEMAIKELNYSPNLVARSLSTRRTQHVAMLVNNLRNPYYTEMLAGAQSVASKKGYIVSIVMVDYADSQENLKLTSRGLDGVIVATIQTNKTVELLGDSIPCVKLGDNLHCSYKDGIFEAVKTLKDYGHRDIAFLSGLRIGDNNERYRYLVEALRFYDLPINKKIMIDGNRYEETNEGAGASALLELLCRKESFTAVFAINDLMAFGAMSVLHKEGYKIPDDISVIGCDNLEIGRYFLPSLSTLDVSAFKIGKYLMKELISKIENKNSVRKELVSSYIGRESVGRCRDIVV